MDSARLVPTRSALVAFVGILLATSGVLATATDVAAARPYRVRHFDLATDVRRNELSWTDEERLRFPARRPRDRHGVPMVRCENGRLYYSPGSLAINSMKRVDAYVETGNARQLAQAQAQALRLRKMAIRRGDGWWLPYRCDYDPERQDAPWFNAMTQGLVISLFVRLYHVTGEEVHLDAARQVFHTFQKLRRAKPWVSFVDGDRYLWLEHYPRPWPDHVLNAHLHAVFGIYELWQVTRSRATRAVLEGAITTMRVHAWRYRRPGSLSLYGLRHRSAIHKYHGIHIWQLRLLARISGDAWFWELADKLRRDASPARYVPGRPQIARRRDVGGLAGAFVTLGSLPPVMAPPGTSGPHRLP